LPHVNSIQRAILCAAPGVMMVGVLAGCPPREGDPGAVEERSDSGLDATGAPGPPEWLFWPRSMRIHPATMIREDRDTGLPMIEARLEFRDRLNHLTKAMGEVRLELHDHNPGEGDDAPLRLWNADLRGIDDNRLHWDHVTETYLFRLALEEAADLPGPWFLRAFVLSSDGRRFSAVMQVK